MVTLDLNIITIKNNNKNFLKNKKKEFSYKKSQNIQHTTGRKKVKEGRN